MATAMGMDPSLIVSGISAVLQAAQTWMAYRDSQRASAAFSDVLARGTSDPALAQAAAQLALAPKPVFTSLGNRVQACWIKYKAILDDAEGKYLPQEIDDATQAVKQCVCRELSRLKSVNGSLPPGEFANWWSQYGCT